MTSAKTAKFRIGQIVRHRIFPFRGVIFDVDPEFANTEEWYESDPQLKCRPAARPAILSSCSPRMTDTEYVAYVSEQNLLSDDVSGGPVRHPQINEMFELAS
jgi:heat shock protein HspQ